MYNPYNWKINERTEISKQKPTLIYNCVLEELGHTCTELDMKKIERKRLLEELEVIKMKIDAFDKDIVSLEERKLHLINDLASHP